MTYSYIDADVYIIGLAVTNAISSGVARIKTECSTVFLYIDCCTRVTVKGTSPVPS
ncbi:MAG: hypothetical protein VKL00_05260 [Synechococcales bacterium]|nr:hypothetical protein [Cyanobacteria bacterium REEB444]MEB3125033.1 hypothetical protein [Synechococcales bacterium]